MILDILEEASTIKIVMQSTKTTNNPKSSFTIVRSSQILLKQKKLFFQHPCYVVGFDT